jgi:glutaredoxin
VARLELFGTARCPYTQEMRDWLQWLGHEFIEYDVDADAGARRRLRTLSGGQRSVPVLVEDDKVVSVGWQGRTCMVEGE